MAKHLQRKTRREEIETVIEKEIQQLQTDLIGEYELVLNLNEEYVEKGINVFYNGNNISSLVKIDSSMVDVRKVGEYKVRYEVNLDGVTEYVYRIVRVRENVKPTIKLKGDSLIYLNVGGVYKELGYEAYDNYDLDINDRVIITNYLIMKKLEANITI